MKKLFCLTWILIFMLSATAFAEENFRIISVSGEGIVETEPDMATVSVGIISRDKDASKVQAQNAQTATDVINSIVALGIDRQNIRTGNYNFHQLVRHDDRGKRIFDGYEANNTVTIKIENLRLVGKVIDAALSHGANRVDSLQFDLKNKESLRMEALQLATRDARAKAEIVARELGRSIIGVHFVTVHSEPISAPRYHKMAMMEAGAVADQNFETPIEGGSMTCTARVDIEFEIN